MCPHVAGSHKYTCSLPYHASKRKVERLGLGRTLNFFLCLAPAIWSWLDRFASNLVFQPCHKQAFLHILDTWVKSPAHSNPHFPPVEFCENNNIGLRTYFISGLFKAICSVSMSQYYLLIRPLWVRPRKKNWCIEMLKCFTTRKWSLMTVLAILYLLVVMKLKSCIHLVKNK